MSFAACLRHLRLPAALVAPIAVALVTFVVLPAVANPVAGGSAATHLIGAMERDLGALRVQLEAIRPAGEADGLHGPGIAYATDLADGGDSFRLRSLATMARAVVYRLDQIELFAMRAHSPSPERDRLRVLRLQVHALHWAVEELRFAGGRDDAGASLARLEELLGDLERSTATLAGRRTGS
jgi:hypothetical protein